MIIQCVYDELVSIDQIKLNPKNTNKHPDKQIEVLADIIKYQGYRVPVIISKESGYVVAGHGRIEALRRLGITEVPVDYQSFESPEVELAAMFSDNSIAKHSDLDFEMLDSCLKELDLNMGEMDLTLLGIIEPEIDFLETEKESSASTPEQTFDIIAKCKDAEERSDLVYELQTRGIEFKARG